MDSRWTFRRRALAAPATTLAALAVVLALACAARSAAAPVAAPGSKIDATGDFASHWFAGKAEVSRYRLEQARYGEVHEGEAVLIFVTEDFLPEKQVKADGIDRARTGAWPILKLNFTKRFDTGIYTYSIMTSTFTPIEFDRHARTLKSTTSVQEWCGHTFLQLNLRDARYRVSGRSYFESEGDADFDLGDAFLEDEIWTRIRIAPNELPEGRIAMIPGGEQHRLRHLPLAVEDADVSLTETAGRPSTYSVNYPAAARTLRIHFDARFPHEILGWEEECAQGGAPGAPMLMTRATRTHSMMIDYWKHNRRADAALRAELGLR